MRKLEGRTFLQCTNCGKIYRVNERISIETVYVDKYCPHCGHKRALNCGENEDDLYTLYNPGLDERYYNY